MNDMDKAIHTIERYKILKENLERALKEGLPLGLEHDIRTDIHKFFQMASLWEIHCRENGLHPFTGRKEGMHQPWPGFKGREDND